MKQIIKTLIALMISTTAFAQASGGNDGHGGGGITRNGRYMTFYSAGFYTEPIEATSEEVPQLSQLIYFFNTNKNISELTKIKYSSKMIPTSTRKYFRVKADSFTPEVRARLIAEYGRVMNVNTAEVALFAVTDTTSRTTYLFPEFYSLKPSEQMAILFHENYWLVKPGSDYKDVIQAEMSFQSYVENPNSPEKLLRWLKSSGTLGDTLIAAVQSDLRTGAMSSLVRRGGRIDLLDLFGDQFFNCKMQRLGAECRPFLTTNAYDLSLKYPNSLFIKLYFESISQGKIDIQYVDTEGAKYFSAWKKLSIDLNSITFSGSPKFITHVPDYYAEVVIEFKD